MYRFAPLFTCLLAAGLFSCQPKTASAPAAEPVADTLRYEGEKHLKNIRQLTFGGDNAEAYFSFDNQHLTLQRANPKEGIPCDQIFWGKIPAANEPFTLNPVSNGLGRTTCSYFMPGDQEIIFASTHLAADTCPPAPDMRKAKRYVWGIYSSFELFVADRKGNILRQLTDNDYYDAEATVSPDGKSVVFTSTRDGDIDLYIMDIDGKNVRRITTEPGYDGGAFFTPDSKQLIFRSSRPKTPEEIADFKTLLSQDMVAPTNMELYIVNVDGTGLKQLTNLGKANWAPFMHPNGKKVIFASNHASETGRVFNLYMMNLDGSELEQITFDEQFDSFPMFSSDGKRLVFASNRNNGGTRDTNLFIADWVD